MTVRRAAKGHCLGCGRPFLTEHVIPYCRRNKTCAAKYIEHRKAMVGKVCQGCGGVLSARTKGDTCTQTRRCREIVRRRASANTNWQIDSQVWSRPWKIPKVSNRVRLVAVDDGLKRAWAVAVDGVLWSAGNGATITYSANEADRVAEEKRYGLAQKAVAV